MKIYRMKKVESTNDEVRKYVGGDNTIVVAEEQTAGRGTKGRSFSSGVGGIYLSIYKKYNGLKASDSFKIMIDASMAVVKTMIAFGVDAKIKWPNDIYVNGKKICGMLIENVLCGDCVAYSVIGIGININNDLPDELKGIATSLKQEGFAVDFESVLSTLIFNLSGQSNIEDYIRYSLVIGKKLTVTQGDKTFECVASGIDERGALILSDGRKLNSAEVKIVGIGD